jgi:hypothetical protein
MNARPCPVGWFSPGEDASVNETANPICQQCPGMDSTSEDGRTTCDGEHRVATFDSAPPMLCTAVRLVLLLDYTHVVACPLRIAGC